MLQEALFKVVLLLFEFQGQHSLPYILCPIHYATYYPDDEDQQVAFDRETAKLWNFISNNGNFTFKSIQDILDELHVCQEETAKDIEMLKKENEDRKVEISTLQAVDVDINDKVCVLEEYDQNNSIKIEEMEESHKADIEEIDGKISALIDEVSDIIVAPIGNLL